MTQESEVKYGDIFGEVAIKFADGKNLNDFCVTHIANYNRDRFEAFAMRLFLGKETVVTIFAREKGVKEFEEGRKIPVKKFKIESLHLTQLLAICESINFTVAVDRSLVDKMEVINR